MKHDSILADILHSNQTVFSINELYLIWLKANKALLRSRLSYYIKVDISIQSGVGFMPNKWTTIELLIEHVHARLVGERNEDPGTLLIKGLVTFHENILHSGTN